MTQVKICTTLVLSESETGGRRQRGDAGIFEAYRGCTFSTQELYGGHFIFPRRSTPIVYGFPIGTCSPRVLTSVELTGSLYPAGVHLVVTTPRDHSHQRDHRTLTYA